MDRQRGLLRVGPRRDAQPLLLRPRDRGRREADDERDLGRALAVLRRRLAHRLRAGRRAPRPRRPFESRPAALDLRPERRGREAPVAGLGREAARGLRPQPQGRARARRGPRGRLHGADREGPHAQPHDQLALPRQVGAVVAGRQEDRVPLRPQRRGRGVARRPGRREARAADERRPGHALRGRVVGGRQPPRLLRQGRPALRRGARRPQARPGRGRPPRHDPRLRLVAEGGQPRLLDERPLGHPLSPRLDRRGRPGAPGDGRRLQRVRAQLGPLGRVPLLPERATLRTPDQPDRVELRRRAHDRPVRPHPQEGRQEPVPAALRRGHVRREEGRSQARERRRREEGRGGRGEALPDRLRGARARA